ncbi:hypothetical protein [Segatella hominis]|uniref:hypothetical protein n=1 Tax=Segatella hominis TaxID=2518605 RepID=UPI003AB93876
MAVDRDYKDFVKTLSVSGENKTFLNSDEDHALEVLVRIFQTAQKDVRIFAGCLCRHVGNKQEYIIALSEFLEKGGTLKILLNKYDQEVAKTSGLYKRLAYYKEKGYPIIVKESKAHPYLTSDPDKKEIHFTVADEKAYRIETDIEKRTAECNFNNPILAQGMTTFFEGLFAREDTKEIDLINLFEDGNK